MVHTDQLVKGQGRNIRSGITSFTSHPRRSLSFEANLFEDALEIVRAENKPFGVLFKFLKRDFERELSKRSFIR